MNVVTLCNMLMVISTQTALGVGAGSEFCLQNHVLGAFVGYVLINVFPQVLMAGIALFALTTLFSFITLPVEINASKRALVWLNDRNHRCF